MIKEITQKESERTKELECLWELLFLNLFSLVAPEDLDLSSSLTLALSFSPPLSQAAPREWDFRKTDSDG